MIIDVSNLWVKDRDARFFYVPCFGAVVNPEATPGGKRFWLYLEQGPFDTTFFIGKTYTGEALVIGHKGPK